MTAMNGKDRSQKLRDKEKSRGIKNLIMKLTETERGWIQSGQDKGGYDDPAEYFLDLVRADIKE